MTNSASRFLNPRYFFAAFYSRGGGGGVLDISSGGEVRPDPSYLDPV